MKSRRHPSHHGQRSETSRRVLELTRAVRNRLIAARTLTASVRLAWALAAIAWFTHFGVWLGLVRIPLAWTSLAAAAACAFFYTAWRLLLNPVTRASAALHLDLRLGLHERTTSALEVLADVPRPGAFDALIIADAAARLKSARPDALVRLHVPWSGILALFLAVVAVVVLTVSPLAGPSASDVAGLQTGTTLVDDVNALRERVGGEASNDRSYMQATYDALDELSQRIESGQISHEQADQEFAALAAHAQSAFARAGLADPLSPRAESQPSWRTVQPGSQFVAPEDARPTPLAEPADRMQAASAAARPEAVPAGDSGASSPGDDEIGSGQGIDGELTPLGNAEGESIRVQGAQDENANLADAAGDPIGGTGRSTPGASSLPGAGTQPFEGTVSDIETEAVREDVTLPSTDRSEGRRIRIEVIPESSPQGFEAAIADSGAWQRAREVVTSSEVVPRSALEVVRNYFTPVADGD